MKFDGKVVIVTGAASGIGEATARAFSAHGASVVLADKDAGKLAKVADSLPGDRTLAKTTDVSVQSDMEALVADAVARFGQLDVLHNNAGIAVEGTVLGTSAEDWTKILATNVSGVFFGSRAALPHLKKTKGTIINTASVSGLGGDLEMAAYNAVKGAVANLTRAMAIDHGRDGVRVNAVCPSLTRTGMTKEMFEDKALVKAYVDRIPLGRPGEPEDIAKAVLLLASDYAGFITGVNLPVDGGVGASNGQPIYDQPGKA